MLNKKIVFLVTVILIMSSMVFFTSSCTNKPNGIVGIETSDVAKVSLFRYEKPGAAFQDVEFASVSISDQETIQALFDTINSVEYEKAELVFGKPEGFYRFRIYDHDDNMLKEINIMTINRIYIGTRYYNSEDTVPFSEYDAIIDQAQN